MGASTPTTGHTTLAFEREGDIGYLRLNTPPRNTMDAAFFEQLARLCRDILPTAPIAGLVVHGSGRHFSAGADVEELRTMINSSHHASFLGTNVDVFMALESLQYPVVAAVSGCCLGAGLELALACHYRVATPRASFGLPETTFDLIPGCGGTIRLPALVGRGTAVRMVLSGQSLLAEEALEAGLVDLVVEKKQLLPTAATLVHRLSAHHAALNTPLSAVPTPTRPLPNVRDT